MKTESSFTTEQNEKLLLDNENVYVRMYSSIFTSGLVSKLGANRFTALMAIASFMDSKGECYPTQNQLADVIGVHRNSVNRYIQGLLEFEIDGKPILTRKKINKGNGEIYSIYRISPLAQLAKFEGKIDNLVQTKLVEGSAAISGKGNSKGTNKGTNKGTSKSTTNGTTNCAVIRTNNTNNNNNKNKPTNKATPTLAELLNMPMNSTTAIKLFQHYYYEKYGSAYVVSNYAREGKNIKDKLVTPFKDNAALIIEKAVKDYEKYQSNPKFPRPSLVMFSWLAMKINDEILMAAAKQAEITKSSESVDDAEQRMLAKLGAL